MFCIYIRMVRMYAKLHKSMEILEYFTTRSWEWTHGHLDLLKSQMTAEDQKVGTIYCRSESCTVTGIHNSVLQWAELLDFVNGFSIFNRFSSWMPFSSTMSTMLYWQDEI